MSPYLSREAEIIALANAIRDSRDPDEAIAKARAAGLTDTQIEQHLDEAMRRDFERRRLQLARAH